MNCRLVRLLSLSTLFMIPFAFGIVNAQTDAEAAAANSNLEVVVNEFENLSEQDTASSFTEHQKDVDLNSNQEVLLTEESKNSVQAPYDEEDAVSETEKSVSLRVESINGILRITDNTGKFYKGMHTIGTKTYCADENARVIVDRFFIYNGRAYISDKTGAIRTGVVFSREYGYYYYCNPAEGGAIKPDAGFVEWNGNRYYVNKGGKIARGGFTLINGRAYIIGNDAVIKTGVQFSNQYGYYYYCNPDEGGAIKPDAGFVEWNGNRYYINKGGKIARGGFTLINGRAYIIGNDAVIKTGVQFSDQYGYYYYCNPDEGGAIKPDAGFVEWNGNRYYINKGGKIARGGFTLINGRAYIIGNDAVIKTGVQFSNQYGYYYYCNPDEGGAIKPDAGFVEWNGNRYYINKGGKIARGGFTLINGRAYIIGNDAVIKTGVQFSNQYGYYYYCNPDEGGAIKPDAGFVEWNGNRYYVNKGGKIAANGFTIIHGTAYIIGKNGVIKTGVVYCSQYGYCYYCDPENGGAIKVDAGYVEWEGKQYYVNKGGKIVPTVEFKAAALMDEIGHSLFNAYKYLAKQPYYRMYVSTSKGKEWFAEFGFSRGEGNCYVKTAMLYYMAKSMGYDNIRAVDGYCLGYGGERLPHGWLEYYENGKTYIIDPTFENEVGRNGYMIQYGQKGTWKYLPNESRTWTE